MFAQACTKLLKIGCSGNSTTAYYGESHNARLSVSLSVFLGSLSVIIQFIVAESI